MSLAAGMAMVCGVRVLSRERVESEESLARVSSQPLAAAECLSAVASAQAGDANEIVVLNKSDLPEDNDWKNFPALRISCATGEGLPQLQKKILSRIRQQNLRPESAVAINTRHRDCLRRALESCDRARSAFGQGISQEYAAVDLDQGLRAVGEVIGVVDVEQILNSVFSEFCIGK